MLSYKKLAWLIATVALLLFVITKLRDILIPFFFAISIAYLFHPVVCFFEDKKISRPIAIIVVYIGLFVLGVFFVFGVIPTIYKQMSNLMIELPVIFADLQSNIDNFHNFFNNRDGIPEGLKNLMSDAILRIEARVVSEIRSLLNVALSSVAYLPLLLLTPFLAFYFLNDSRDFALRFIRLFPEKHHKNITAFIYDLNNTLMHYIRGQITVGLVIGALMTTGLLLIGMPMAIFLGALAGIAELIPFFGAVLSGSVIIFFALTVSTKKAALAFALFVVMQQLEANVVTPKILGDSVGLHPLSIIFLILLGGKYFGLAGMFFIVPFFAVLRIVFLHAVPFIRSLESN